MPSRKNNDNGRAYEFAYLIVFEEKIKPHRNISIIKNSSYDASKSAWLKTDEAQQKIFLLSANAGVDAILEAEPLMLETAEDSLEIKIQPDGAGKSGDVRDIVITRKNIKWEIGISAKNNHFAVKHSRLSSKLDFGEKWFGIKCSDSYWKDIAPIFELLKKQKAAGLKWNELPNKEVDVYRPLLNAFLQEVKQSYEKTGQVMAKAMAEYLIGKFDFYKAVCVTKKRVTQIQPYNFRGELNQPAKSTKPKIIIPKADLPTRIIHIDFKPDSNTTVELFMDNGWQFSFRIHNAKTKVELSLKFDVQLVGMPSSIILLECKWE